MRSTVPIGERLAGRLCSVACSVWFAIAVLVIVALPVLSGVQRFAFRDVSFFYTPLYDYLARQTAAGTLPLWNPLDQTGIPVVGESTTALFYPIRALIYALPLDGDVAMSWYIVVHWVLAAVAMRDVAIGMSRRRSVATACGIIYAFSGCVMTLAVNPPFLVSAAWLPWAITPMVVFRSGATTWLGRCFRGGDGWWASVAMAMMVLGGDPQTALHVGLIALAVTLVRWVGFAKSTRVRNGESRRWQRSPSPWIVAVPCLAAALSAPQIAGSMAWVRQSERSGQQIHDELADAPEMGAWWAPPKVGSRRYQSYQFSVAPWHITELVVPVASGRLLPQYRRISHRIPGDGQVWTPSLYTSAALVVGLAAWCRGRRRRRIWREAGWWWGIAGVCLWASMGWFGVVWAVQNVLGFPSGIDSAIGGPYWWLYQFVPGYDAFRYPAKWLPVFAFASTAALAVTSRLLDRRVLACGLDAGAPPLRAALVTAFCVAGVSMTGAVGLWLAGDGLIDRMGAGAASIRDEYWGPLDVAGALGEIRWRCIHAALAFGGLALCLHYRRHDSAAWTIGLLAVITLDVSIAAIGTVPTLNRSAEQQVLEAWAKESPVDPGDEVACGRWLRTRQQTGWPSAWRGTSNDDRLLEVEASQRMGWFGRWHLADSTAVLNSMTSIRSHAMGDFWRSANRITASMTAAEGEAFWRSVRRWLGIRGRVHQTESFQRLMIDGRPLWVGDVKFLPDPGPENGNATDDGTFQWSTAALVSRQVSTDDVLNRVWKSDGRPIPTIETNADSVAVTLPQQPVQASVDVQLAADGDTSISTIVECDHPILLIRPVLQDGGWTASVTTDDFAGGQSMMTAPVVPVDRLKQGVVLPAGRHVVWWEYRPAWFWPSMAIAALAWMTLAIGILWGWFKNAAVVTRPIRQ
ncbi:hypothetical protein [Crateriforma conspicua]|uniref:Bacterial membrane protein YfhO n=1 Tax=Crateriforma conspicua TaxID=2527996 RepID=A0A5C5XZ07_9PLAN|nr:hypothetical protein [Crateriforma conspicua]TWT67948.1 hypothetical protein Pan14r_01860 [Crateriforma conspicua]